MRKHPFSTSLRRLQLSNMKNGSDIVVCVRLSKQVNTDFTNKFWVINRVNPEHDQIFLMHGFGVLIGFNLKLFY